MKLSGKWCRLADSKKEKRVTVKVGTKNPKSEWWSYKVKVPVERKVAPQDILGAKDMTEKE